MPSTRRRTVVAATSGALLLVAATLLSLGAGDDDGTPRTVPGLGGRSETPTPSSRPPASGPVAATAALVGDLERALAAGDVAAARTLGRTPPARRLAAALARNADRLDVVGLDLEPVAQAPAPAPLVRRYGAGTWVTKVRVGWRYAGVDRRPVASTARFVLSVRRGGAALDATRPVAGGQTPPWLLEPLEVRRDSRILVAAPDAAAASRLLAQAADAATLVGRRLPWRGDLVVEASATVPGFRAATGLGPAAGGSIAAVTTTADGSTRPGSPERVFLNPRVFEPLGPPSQGIVLRHEATHVAVGAAASAAPLWLTEGFADWVALAGSPLPVRALASQALAQVREEGAPSRLPDRDAFAPDAPDLGAAYESSWLAVRLIARDHGRAALLRFQRLADTDGALRGAFREALGTSEAAFTRVWRRELVRLAG